MSDLIIRGFVAGGRGMASSHIGESIRELEHLTGDALFPGSLNLTMSRPLRLNPGRGLSFDSGSRMLWNARIGDLPVLLYRWLNTPLHILEVLSTHRLREYLPVEDGDCLEVSVDRDLVEELTAAERLWWAVAWYGREAWYYDSRRYDRYARILKSALKGGPVQERRSERRGRRRRRMK